MPQALIIQTESVAPTSSKHSPKAKATADGEAFSAHLDKQVKQAEIGSAQTDKAQAASPAETDKDIAADGNNLPAEATEEKVPAETDGEVADTSDDTNGETGETASSEPSEPSEETAPSVDTAEDVNVNSATSPVQQTTQASASKDKPIRAQVTVSQQAIDHAKAAPVEMTAKEHPKQPTEGKADEVTAKVVTESDKTLSKLTKTEAVASTLSNKAAVDTNSTDKPAAPNLAAVLKQDAEEGSKTPKIRADILEALQRQQSKPEVGLNLRNQIASQMSAKVDSSPTAPLPSILTDSNTAPVSTLVAGSVLTASGQSAAQGNALSPAVLSLPIQPGMQNPAWTQVMSSRVVWMAKEGVQQAQLRMNPANLGPVEVKLHVQNDQASVTFLAQHSATRDALEQALPRLRESFAENGMELTNAQVGEQQQQHREQSEQANESPIFTQASGQDDDIETETVETVSSEQTSGLSLYA